MKRNMKTYTKAHTKVFLYLAILLVTLSCNEDFPELLKEEYGDENFVGMESGKVLYILIDGAGGEAIRAAAPPHIMGLTDNALYTFNSLADAFNKPLSSAMGWANLLTGVNAEKHNVVSNDFVDNQLAQYPSFLTLLEQTKPDLNTVAYSSSVSFSENFTQDAEVSEVFENDDAQVAQAVVNELVNNAPDLILAQFHGVESTGDASGYNNNPAYLDAILQVDEYVGTIIEALQSRPKYKQENWMVVITSNIGDNPETPTIAGTPFEDQTRNTFTLMYSERFNAKLIQKPVATDVNYDGYGVRYTYTNNDYVNATLEDPQLFNMGKEGEMTIQFMIKNRVGTYGWPTFLSKREYGFSGPGWNLFLKGDFWAFNSSMSWEMAGGTVSDGLWHVITVVFSRKQDIESKVRIYTDGVFNEEAIYEHTWDEVTNNIPLRIGRIPSDGDSNPDLLLTNLQIYDKALTDDDIKAIFCLPEVNASHPYYENLRGFWPGNESEGKVIHETLGKLGDNADFILSGPYSWRDFSDNSPNVCPPSPDSFYRLVPNSVDIPFQIFQWLGARIKQDWSLDGKGWTPSYKAIQP